VKASLTRIVMMCVLVTGAMLVACSSDDGGDETPSGDTTAAATSGGGGEVDEGLVKQGRTLAAAQCWGCHTEDGSASVGPTWLGIFGETVTLGDGSTVDVDEAYIRESIADPSAKVVEGFAAGTMPTFTTLTDDDINAIVAYIKSLGE